MSGKLIPGLSYEDYCALPGVNASLLKVVDRYTLQHAKAELNGLIERESDALDFGHAFHELLLRQREDFVIRPATYPAPKGHKTAKEGDPLPWTMQANYCKAWVKEHAAGCTVLDEGEACALRGMVAAVAANEDVAPYISGQMEIAATSERNGIAHKALVDLLPEAGPVIDFKKCRSASPRAFVQDAIKMGYHLQMAFYLDVLADVEGERRKSFWLVAVEDKPPFGVCVVKFSDTPMSLIRVGRNRYKAALRNLLHARETGRWPGYEACESPVDFTPAWMKEELEQTA